MAALMILSRLMLARINFCTIDPEVVPRSGLSRETLKSSRIKREGGRCDRPTKRSITPFGYAIYHRSHRHVCVASSYASFALPTVARRSDLEILEARGRARRDSDIGCAADTAKEPGDWRRLASSGSYVLANPLSGAGSSTPSTRGIYVRSCYQNNLHLVAERAEASSRNRDR